MLVSGFTSCLLPIDIRKLLKEPSYNMWGSIDMFSLLQTLMPRNNGNLGECWLQSSKFLRIVSRFRAVWFVFGLTKFSFRINFVVRFLMRSLWISGIATWFWGRSSFSVFKWGLLQNPIFTDKSSGKNLASLLSFVVSGLRVCFGFAMIDFLFVG